MTTPVDMALEDVAREMARQVVLKKAGRFKFTCSDSGMSNAEKLAVLVEEVGEVARAVMENARLANDVHGAELRKELIQVAAVAAAWVVGLDAAVRKET